jgi:hypothetical protein
VGILTYLLLCANLPFDHEDSEKEIVRQTIHKPTPFPPKFWDKLSLDSRDFVDSNYLLTI